LQRLGFAPRCPVVIAPRGEFSLGAIKLKSWKKVPFVMLMQSFGIYKNVVWHASSALEIADVSRAMGVDHSRCYEAPNITEVPRLSESPLIPPSIRSHQPGAGNQPLSICFLSRISFKKNLDYALRVLSDVSIPVQFDIFGPKEIPSYWEMCQQLIGRLPTHIKVSYGGTVEHSQVCSTISKYELFFLPTRGENFGHVFIESWLAGVPVLISDQTPWRGLVKQNLGWDIPLDSPDEFVKALEAFANLDEKQRQTMRQRCLQFAHEKAEGAEALQLNRRLLLGALGLPETKLPSQG
jgi:glycosyltransferase involved in cell wall biosynthesis